MASTHNTPTKDERRCDNDDDHRRQWNLPSRHYIAPHLFPSSRRRASIETTTNDIITCIWVQKSTATDQYSLSYGLASFDFKTRHRIIKIRRAITRWILVLCRRFLQLNEDNDVEYILTYHMESTHRYWRRYGSAGFGMRNQSCLHIKHNNFIETWYF